MDDSKKKDQLKKETLEPKNVNPMSAQNIFSDVLGSYTGIPEDGGQPTQDADDL